MRPAAAAAVALVLAGCGDGGARPTGWNGTPERSADGRVQIGAFNDFLAGDGSEFAGSPVAAVTEFLRLDESSAARTTIVATSPGEVRNFSEVLATLDGLLDDSIRAMRYTVELQRDEDGTWRLRAADWAQRCHEGRGHAAFSPDPCL